MVDDKKGMRLTKLLKNYKEWVETGRIQFLKKGSEGQRDVLQYLKDLILTIEKVTVGTGFNEGLDWREAHIKGEALWKSLASSALRNIDPESKGNSELFGFLDKATEFEDILYGLEEYYRDHTLHSLWVYLIGEYILREHLPNIHADLRWFLSNDIEAEKKDYSSSLIKKAKNKEEIICRKVNEKRDAIWCIMALCHDLGYSLEKLSNLNDKVKNVLKFFDIPDFQHIGYSLEIEHQYLISQFLELMAMDVRIVPDENMKDVLVKCYRDDSTYWTLCRALEKKQHGILSAYLIYKILYIFQDTSVRGTAEVWGLDDDEAKENIIRGDILYAIAQHTFDYAYLRELSSLTDVLILADELEEFSRYGRELLSRTYHDTTAEASISFTPSHPRQGDDLEIFVTYEVAKHLSSKDFYKFFKGKAEQVYKIYSLVPEQENEKNGRFCRIKSIKITVKREGEELYFHYRGPDKTKGFLPKTRIGDKDYPADVYSLECQDDRIRVKTKGRVVGLDEWFDGQSSVE